MQQKKFFHYHGTVKHFDSIISRNFDDTTMAVSEKQALSNLQFKAKRKLGYNPESKLTLDIKYLN
jgi:hypothetical protein